MPELGIDVSYAQGEIDWEKVANDGVKFAIIRAGYGNSSNQEDAQFKNNMKGTEENGIKRGIYWYSYALSPDEAQLEAEACYNVIKNYSFSLPVVFDIEDESQINLGNSTFSQIVDTFCGFFSNKGYRVAIYSFKSWLESSRFSDDVLNKYDVFLSHFVNYNLNYDTREPIDSTEYNRTSYPIWQFSNCGHIDGISNQVDLDYAYEDFSDTNKEEGSIMSQSTPIEGYFSHPLRENYKTIGMSTHDGHREGQIDFACAEGTKVYSMSNGIVFSIFENHASMGNAVVIKASGVNLQGDLYFRYLHLSEIKVSANSTVKAGDLIGLSGNTGDSDGAHLHIDILDDEYGDVGEIIMLSKSNFKTEAVQGYIELGNIPTTEPSINETRDTGPYLSAIMAQKVVTVRKGSSYSNEGGGGITTEPNNDTPLDDDLRNYYFHSQFTEDFMGEKVSTYLTQHTDKKGKLIDDEILAECPILRVVGFGFHETGNGANGEFSFTQNTPEYNTALMATKLFRGMLVDSGSDWLNKENLKLFIDSGDKELSDIGAQAWWGQDDTIKKYKLDDNLINFADLAYNNLCYPSIYGISDDADVVVGNGRYYAICAIVNSSDVQDTISYLPKDESYNLKYHYAERLTNKAQQCCMLRYTSKDNNGDIKASNVLDDIMIPYTPPQYIENRLPSDIDEIASETVNLSLSQLEEKWGSLNIDGPWCAAFAKRCIQKTPALSSWAAYMTDSSTITLKNLIDNGCPYYVPTTVYALDKQLAKTNFSLDSVQTGDILIICRTEDCTSPSSERQWDHTTVIKTINGNDIVTVEGNMYSNAGDSTTGSRHYTINGNSLNTETECKYFAIVHLT